MTPTRRALAIGVAVGLVGWLIVGALRSTDGWLFVGALAVGACAAALSGRAEAVLGVGLGVLASYPVALSVGLIAFLGENWLLSVAVAELFAALGFVVWLSIRALAWRWLARRY